MRGHRWFVVVALLLSATGAALAQPRPPPPPPRPRPGGPTTTGGFPRPRQPATSPVWRDVREPPRHRLDWHEEKEAERPAPVRRGFTLAIDAGGAVNSTHAPTANGDLLTEGLAASVAAGGWLWPRAALLVRADGTWQTGDGRLVAGFIGPEAHVAITRTWFVAAGGGLTAATMGDDVAGRGLGAELRTGLDGHQGARHAVHLEVVANTARYGEVRTLGIGLRLGWRLY